MGTCKPCRDGRHPSHDRFRDGTDAGCPNLVHPASTHGVGIDNECRCSVVLPSLSERGTPCPTCSGTGRV